MEENKASELKPDTATKAGTPQVKASIRLPQTQYLPKCGTTQGNKTLSIRKLGINM